MEYFCPICPRRTIYHYAHHQHLRVEHRRWQCEVCDARLATRHEYLKHQNDRHTLREHALVEERWRCERLLEGKIQHEVWTKGMIADNVLPGLREIRTLVDDIVATVYGDITGAVRECQSGLLRQLREVSGQLHRQELALAYYDGIENTLTHLARKLDVYNRPKFQPPLPAATAVSPTPSSPQPPPPPCHDDVDDDDI